MRRILPGFVLRVVLMWAASTASAQNLTPSQKEADFRYLAGLFSTYYAPLEWKKQLFHFDALSIQSWLDRAARPERTWTFTSYAWNTSLA